MDAILFLSLLLILYAYLGYPAAVACLAGLLRREVRKAESEPAVSVVIAAYNEAPVIAATIENKLGLDYPDGKLEIVVVSDGSTDGTDAVVARFAARGVRLVRQEPRGGKTSALNLALASVTGEIVVFSDANSLYAPDALRALVANFADPQVGYVTGRMVYLGKDGKPAGEGCGAYMRYENRLRLLETGIGSVVGVDGGIDAVRRSLYRPMAPDQLPDFVLPLMVVDQGYRVVYEPQALLCEQALVEDADEYRMRVRVSLRALWAMFAMRRLLNPLRFPLFAWQLFSHKVLRYLVFLFLVLAYLSSAIKSGAGGWYLVLFLAQNLFYLAAAAARFAGEAGLLSRLLTFSRYFCLVNLAAGHAFLKFLMGKKQVLWQPRKG